MTSETLNKWPYWWDWWERAQNLNPASFVLKTTYLITRLYYSSHFPGIDIKFISHIVVFYILSSLSNSQYIKCRTTEKKLCIRWERFFWFPEAKLLAAVSLPNESSVLQLYAKCIRKTQWDISPRRVLRMLVEWGLR